MATKQKTTAAAPAPEDQNPDSEKSPEPTPPAENKKAAKRKIVELRDKDTGFYDQVTGFQIVRDQKVELGSTIGDATNVAIASGRLLIVQD